jgi:hypothetical protein
MASTYSDLKIELIGTGEQTGTWGTTTNTNLGTAIEDAITGSADVTFSGADITLTLTNTNAAQTARNLRLVCIGTSGGARQLILGSGCQINKLYLIQNNLADSVTVKNTTGTGVTIPAGKKQFVFNNGTDVVEATTATVNLASDVTGTLPTANGGTGSTSTTYCNLASNVTGTLPIANGGTGSTSTTYCGLTTNVTGTLPIANGGTGQTGTPTNGQLLIGNGTSFTRSTITAGSGITVTNGSGSITIAATGGGAGDVVGPASATDNSVALFDGATGKLIKTSVSNVGNLNGVRIGSPAGGSIAIYSGGSTNLSSLTSGLHVAVGANIMTAQTGGNLNVGLGANILTATQTSQFNIGIGGNVFNSANVTGQFNVGLGASVASSLTSGGSNIGIGLQSLLSLTTGGQNTAVGASTLTAITTESNCAGIGNSAAVTGSNQVQLGNSSTTTYAYGAVQDRSDLRDKADVRNTQLGLNFITALRPVDFKWDYREDYIPSPPLLQNFANESDYQKALTKWKQEANISNITHNGTHKRNRYHHGLIAQEVKAVLDAQGVDFGGYQDHSMKGGKDVLSIGYNELIAPMIKAIQELKSELDVVKAELAFLKTK